MAAIVRQRAKEITGHVRDDYREWFTEYAEYFNVFESAPLLLIPTFRYAPTLSLMVEPHDASLAEMERDNVLKSISGVTILLLLAAESLGLGACYLTGPLIAEPELSKIIAVKPGRNIGAIIPVGYPNKENKLKEL